MAKMICWSPQHRQKSVQLDYFYICCQAEKDVHQLSPPPLALEATRHNSLSVHGCCWHASSAGSREEGRHYQRKQSTMRAQFNTPPHMCMYTHIYTHTVKYEKGGRDWGAVKCSTCPGRRGLTVVASFQPQGFNATLISGGLDIPDHSLLISCESAFPAQMSTFCGRLDSTGKKIPCISVGYWFLFSN